MNSAKIKDYYLIVSGDVSDLNQRVMKHITQGWQPFGSPSTAYDTEYDNLTLCQAVVRYAPEKRAKRETP